MPRGRIYGISTSLFSDQRLSREHLRAIAAAGFTAIALEAEGSHFAYHNESNVADLQGWLGDTGLVLSSIQAPRRFGDPAPSHGQPALASPDTIARQFAVDDTERAIFIARRIPCSTFVIRVDAARQPDGSTRSSRDGLKRSLETLDQAARPLGVSLAIALGPDPLAEPRALAHFVDDLRDTCAVGICLDSGQAHLRRDLVDAIDTISEHVSMVHISDNRGRSDDRLVPFEGTIDWPAAVTTLQKIGYDGPIVFDLDGRRARADLLARAQKARRQLDRLFAD